jgi:cytochrome c
VNESPSRSPSRWPVVIVIGLFILITAVFIIAFVTTTQSEMATMSEPTLELHADTYLDEVEPLLEGADPENGARLVEQHGCIACHRLPSQDNIAPRFEGMGEHADTRRPPLNAAAYIYESIVHPLAFVVEDYQVTMPQNYRELLSDRELGDIIAYLLTSDAN